MTYWFKDPVGFLQVQLVYVYPVIFLQSVRTWFLCCIFLCLCVDGFTCAICFSLFLILPFFFFFFCLWKAVLHAFFFFFFCLWKAVLHACGPASVAQLDAPSDWRPGGRGFNPRRGRQHSFVEIDHEIFSTVILSLPLIQEGQLSVSGERMCTILVNSLED